MTSITNVPAITINTALQLLTKWVTDRGRLYFSANDPFIYASLFRQENVDTKSPQLDRRWIHETQLSSRVQSGCRNAGSQFSYPPIISINRPTFSTNIKLLAPGQRWQWVSNIKGKLQTFKRKRRERKCAKKKKTKQNPIAIYGAMGEWRWKKRAVGSPVYLDVDHSTRI